LQLLGGVWILKIFPAVVFSLYTRRLTSSGLLAGWFVGIVAGTGMAIGMGLKPVYPLQLGGATYLVYICVLALAANIVVSVVVTAVMPRTRAAGPVAAMILHGRERAPREGTP
jgi:SSS family solute:Na+ symporter